MNTVAAECRLAAALRSRSPVAASRSSKGRFACRLPGQGEQVPSQIAPFRGDRGPCGTVPLRAPRAAAPARSVPVTSRSSRQTRSRSRPESVAFSPPRRAAHPLEPPEVVLLETVVRINRPPERRGVEADPCSLRNLSREPRHGQAGWCRFPDTASGCRPGASQSADRPKKEGGDGAQLAAPRSATNVRLATARKRAESASVWFNRLQSSAAFRKVYRRRSWGGMSGHLRFRVRGSGFGVRGSGFRGSVFHTPRSQAPACGNAPQVETEN